MAYFRIGLGYERDYYGFVTVKADDVSSACESALQMDREGDVDFQATDNFGETYIDTIEVADDQDALEDGAGETLDDIPEGFNPHRDSHRREQAMRQALRDLVEWAKGMGSWEAAPWVRAVDLIGDPEERARHRGYMVMHVKKKNKWRFVTPDGLADPTQHDSEGAAWVAALEHAQVKESELESDANPFHPESPEGRAWERGDRSCIGGPKAK
jgi:hypothetical protein